MRNAKSISGLAMYKILEHIYPPTFEWRNKGWKEGIMEGGMDNVLNRDKWLWKHKFYSNFWNKYTMIEHNLHARTMGWGVISERNSTLQSVWAEWGLPFEES